MSLELFIQNLINGTLLGFVYSLVALGLALQFGVMDIINFGHGEFVMVAMYLTFWISLFLAIPGSATVVLTAPIFFVFGIIIYKLVIDKVIEAQPLSQIAVTIGLLILLRNFALAAWHAEPKGLQYQVLVGGFKVGDYVISISRLATAIVSLVVLIVLHLILTKTYFGIAIRATSDDKVAAALLGVNVKKMYTLVFGLGCAIIAIAASFIMTFQQVEPMSGMTWGLLSWVIVAMGGLGGLSGVLAAGLIVGIAQGIEITFWDPRASLAIVYLLFILLLWFKPKGLFGKR